MGVWVRLAVQSILHSDQKDQVAYLTYCLSPPPPKLFQRERIGFMCFQHSVKKF